MSIMYGQVKGRKHASEQSLLCASQNESTQPDKKKQVLASIKLFERAQEQKAIRRAAEPAGLKSVELKTNANDEPDIASYQLNWPDMFIYVEAPGVGQRKLFGSVVEAAKYINGYDGTDELTPAWLSFLIENGYGKYKGYFIGLVDRDAAARQMLQRLDKSCQSPKGEINA